MKEECTNNSCTVRVHVIAQDVILAEATPRRPAADDPAGHKPSD